MAVAALHVPMLSYAGGRIGVRLEKATSAAGVASPPPPPLGAHTLEWLSHSDVVDSSADDAPDDPRTVHCFSLASGALYERFLRIMMASAAERSSAPLKFWLLSNFLSPAFRREVRSGELARAVGAKVAIVHYAWPEHLRYQTEKQRLIWGYKILFLDVLFPQSVKKVIYVDADQIVQGDLAELWAFDLGGRPVAMTPFCQADPNPDTTGFRFWSSGFWKTHLGEQPYHISALFVVDLQQVRTSGVANIYRDTYQSLTADPSSLSNLDQDLPNYLQHAVPMRSLPEEWLWCETWCGNASKPHAKTIDLCNNPLTKEPKLDQARRIGGERWAAIDARLERALQPQAQPGTRGSTEKTEL